MGRNWFISFMESYLMYKDKDKQREANRRAQARFKAKKVLAEQGVSSMVLPDVPRVSDQDFTKLLAQVGPGHVRVSKPGDADYEPQCETTKAFVGKLPSPGEFYHSGAEMGGTNE